MKNYLQVNYDGSIFQYSKEDKEGFIKHENSKGKVSYRKYFNKGVDGTLTGISKENNQYLNNAEEVRLTLQNGDNENILTFTVLNQDGNSMDDYTEALTLLLPKMNKGETYNINADTAAGAIAAAVGASRLLLMTDVAGVLDKQGTLISELTMSKAEELTQDGTISGGMIPKLETCLETVRGGVHAAVILDGRVAHSMLLEIFTDCGIGTMIKKA